MTKLRPAQEPLPAPAAAIAEVRTADKAMVAGPQLADAKDLDAATPVYPDDPRPFDLTGSTMLDPAAIAPDPSKLSLPPGTIYHVESATGSLRAGPSLSYAELATLHRGQEVIATGEASGDWLWVRTRGGALSGYVLSDRLIRAN
ncbi:MAG: SH3 domain-containing protein [Rhodobacteraceae bacterium]|nr:SH3 domain-containing protein [Paracoccaceae bacterium]